MEPIEFDPHHEENMKALKKWLTEMLHTEEVTVTFTKKDGTERVMRCTLKPEALPVVEEVKETTSKATKTKSEDSLSVWDLDATGWRSFRWDSLKSIQFSLV
jgi:hypothetical protein